MGNDPFREPLFPAHPGATNTLLRNELFDLLAALFQTVAIKSATVQATVADRKCVGCISRCWLEFASSLATKFRTV